MARAARPRVRPAPQRRVRGAVADARAPSASTRSTWPARTAPSPTAGAARGAVPDRADRGRATATSSTTTPPTPTTAAQVLSAPPRPTWSPTSWPTTPIPAANPLWGPRFQLQTDDGRRPATLKTGTTNDFRDLQAYGYLAGNPDDPEDPTGAIVTGVWVGNSDFCAIARRLRRRWADLHLARLHGRGRRAQRPAASTTSVGRTAWSRSRSTP